MNKKTKLICGAAACVAVGLAIATPQVGLISSKFLTPGNGAAGAGAKIVKGVNTHAHVVLPGDEEGWSAQLEIEGSSDVHVGDVLYAPGATTGWHTHPGLLLLTLADDSGPINWYDANCNLHVYNAGDAWTEGTSLHDLVVGGANAHFIITYIVRGGQPRRLDHAAPPCATALGLK